MIDDLQHRVSDVLSPKSVNCLCLGLIKLVTILGAVISWCVHCVGHMLDCIAYANCAVYDNYYAHITHFVLFKITDMFINFCLFF